jgi:hypothetical protein
VLYLATVRPGQEIPAWKPQIFWKKTLGTRNSDRQFCRWIKMQNCRVTQTHVVNLYIRYKIWDLNWFSTSDYH